MLTTDQYERVQYRMRQIKQRAGIDGMSLAVAVDEYIRQQDLWPELAELNEEQKQMLARLAGVSRRQAAARPRLETQKTLFD